MGIRIWEPCDDPNGIGCSLFEDPETLHLAETRWYPSSLRIFDGSLVNPVPQTLDSRVTMNDIDGSGRDTRGFPLLQHRSCQQLWVLPTQGWWNSKTFWLPCSYSARQLFPSVNFKMRINQPHNVLTSNFKVPWLSPMGRFSWRLTIDRWFTILRRILKSDCLTFRIMFGLLIPSTELRHSFLCILQIIYLKSSFVVVPLQAIRYPLNSSHLRTRLLTSAFVWPWHRKASEKVGRSRKCWSLGWWRRWYLCRMERSWSLAARRPDILGIRVWETLLEIIQILIILRTFLRCTVWVDLIDWATTGLRPLSIPLIFLTDNASATKECHQLILLGFITRQSHLLNGGEWHTPWHMIQPSKTLNLISGSRNLMLAGSNPNPEVINGTKYHR